MAHKTQERVAALLRDLVRSEGPSVWAGGASRLRNLLNDLSRGQARGEVELLVASAELGLPDRLAAGGETDLARTISRFSAASTDERYYLPAAGAWATRSWCDAVEAWRCHATALKKWEAAKGPASAQASGLASSQPPRRGWCLLFLNLKGGVAKTTVALGVAEFLAGRGKRVLVVDADHQGSASELTLGERRLRRAEDEKRTFHDLLVRMLNRGFESPQVLGEYVHQNCSNVANIANRVSVIPGSYRLDDFHSYYVRARRDHPASHDFPAHWSSCVDRLTRSLRRSFDAVLVDCPPSLTSHVRSLLRHSDGFVVPCIPDRLSVKGALGLVVRLQQARSSAAAVGTVWTLFREANAHHRATVALMNSRHGAWASLPPPFSTRVPNSVDFVRAMEDGTHPTLQDKYGRVAMRVFGALAEEICLRMETS